MRQEESGDRRLVGEVFRFWHSRCGPDGMPGAGDLDSLCNEPFWARSFVLDMSDDEAPFHVSHWGTELAEFAGPPATGVTDRQVGGAVHLTELMEGLSTAAAQARRPVANSATAVDRNGNEVLYRLIVLPVGDGSGGVSAVFGAASFKAAAG